MSGMEEYDDDEGGWNFVMPFVVVHTAGGPYDDDAFCAGYEVGQIAGRLDSSIWDKDHTLVRRAVLPQVDLIAMHLGWTMKVDELNDDWVGVDFERVLPVAP